MPDLIFVSAQPDVQYFHWQVRVYVENFLNQGINPKNIHVLFGMWNTNIPSVGGIELKKLGINVHFYEDLRKEKRYHPSIKPYLIHKWLEQYPNFGDIFFLHDSDIIFRELPNYQQFLLDDNCYMGDTISYIGYEYLKSCSERYEQKYPNLGKLELLKNMTDIVGINLEVIKEYQKKSGGAQYIIKNTNKDNWLKIYNDSNKLYFFMLEFHKKNTITHGAIQFWTAEMWSTLWNLWLLSKKTEVIDELGFCTATDSIDIYEKKPILHMAGVLDNMKTKKFYKGDYLMKNPIDLLIDDENYFDFIEKNSSTIKYVEVLKTIAKKHKSNYL